MPQAAKILLFICALPFLAGLGHDVYLNYFSDDEKMREIKNLQVNPQDFMMSDLGWVWQRYSPNTMEMVRGMVEPKVWENKIDPILQEPTLLVTAAPIVAAIIALLVTFVLGVWPFTRIGHKRKESKTNFGVYKNAKGKKVSYKKK